MPFYTDAAPLGLNICRFRDRFSVVQCGFLTAPTVLAIGFQHSERERCSIQASGACHTLTADRWQLYGHLALFCGTVRRCNPRRAPLHRCFEGQRRGVAHLAQTKREGWHISRQPFLFIV